MYDNLTRTNLEFAYQKAEKRIKELEQKLEQTEKDLADYQFNYPKIKDLEQENAELKGSLELYESGGCKATKLFECGVVKELKDQLYQSKRDNKRIV